MDSASLDVFDAKYHPVSYWLTRFVMLRLLGLVYAVAFLVAVNQIIPIFG